MMFALVFMAIMLTMSVTLIAMAGLHARAERRAAAGLAALKLAEAGVDKAIYELNQNQNFTGESDVPIPGGAFSTTVTTIDANNKQIISTGRASFGGAPATSTVSAVAAIDLETVSFQFGVQVGEGGLEMKNNSRINGNVFANGSISGSGIVTGDATTASSSALAGPTSISGITVWGAARSDSVLDCVIGQDAFYQTTNTCAVAGAEHPGTPAPDPQPFPVSDAQIAGWENAAAAGGVIVGDYLLPGDESASLGPIKIEGNLTVENSAALLLNGPVWVQGNVVLKNNSVIQNSAALGAGGTVLLADDPAARSVRGTMTIENGVVIAGNGNVGNYPLLISLYSGSGKAIAVKNNTSSTIFYAPYGTIEVSNNSSPIQLTANRIEIENNATVNYTTGLQNALFTSGPGGSWVYKPGTYVIVKN